MQETRAFEPLYRSSVPTASTPVSGSLIASVTLGATDASQATARLPGNGNFTQLRIANKSTSWAHVNFGVFGDVPAATVAASYPIPPASVEVVTVDPEVTGATVILATPAATGDVIFTRGGGL